MSANKTIIITKREIDGECRNNYGIIEIESKSEIVCRWNLKIMHYRRIYIGISTKSTDQECIHDSMTPFTQNADHYIFSRSNGWGVEEMIGAHWTFMENLGKLMIQ